jgi:hypothetical protein
MAQQLSKTGIASLGTIKPGHVSQSIDAFTGTEAYNIFLSGSFNMTGSINGEPGVVNQLTASYATSASHAVSSTTSSYSVTSSYSNTSTSASYSVSSSHSLTSSYSGDAISSSYALTSSYVENAQTASFITASNVYGPNGSNSVISSSYALTSSYSNTSTSASHAISSSYALTASFTPELVGTQYYIPSFDLGYGLINSQIYDNGANVLIGITGSSNDKFQIYNSTNGYTALRVNQTKTGNILLLQTGSQEIFKVETSGLTSLTGSLNISGSTSFVGTHTLSGSNTIIGTTVLSGSIDVSGSSNFHNTTFIVTGSQFFTGSSHFIGSQDITGSLKITGSNEGSGFYIDGNKQFNYASYANTSSISGSANVSHSFSYDSPDGSSGISLISGSRITFSHSGVYNIQFSAQLHTQTGATVHIWFKETGSNIPESGTRVGPTANGDYLAPAWNFVKYFPSGSYAELAWQSDQDNTQFPYIAATGNIPSCPAIILTVTQVR